MTMDETIARINELYHKSKEGSGLTDDQIAILRTLTDEPMLVDDLIEATQIPARRVLSALTVLEIVAKFQLTNLIYIKRSL